MNSHLFWMRMTFVNHWKSCLDQKGQKLLIALIFYSLKEPFWSKGQIYYFCVQKNRQLIVFHYLFYYQKGEFVNLSHFSLIPSSVWKNNCWLGVGEINMEITEAL